MLQRGPLQFAVVLACLAMVLGGAPHQVIGQAATTQPSTRPTTQPATQPGAGSTSAAQSVLREVEARVAFSASNLESISAAAAVAAERAIEHPQSLINVPYGPQQGFAEEVLNRAGGLSNALPSVERSRQTTDHDVSMVSVRAWDVDGPTILKEIAQHRERGWLIILFASKAGAPDDLDVDWLIDNGAASGDAAHAPVNAIANATNAWLWIAEYVGALSQHGRYPGFLMSIFMEGSDAHNRERQRVERRYLGETDARFAPGELAGRYLARVRQIVAACATPTTLAEIDAAAAVIAEAVQAGRDVKLATCLHLLMFEIYADVKTPMKPFHGYRGAMQAFERNVEADDLLVYFAYVGMWTPYEDYGAAAAAVGADLVSSYVPHENPARNHPKPVAQINQHWDLPDAELEVPFPPRRILPVSGVNQAILFRMLDAAAAARLAD